MIILRVGNWMEVIWRADLQKGGFGTRPYGAFDANQKPITELRLNRYRCLLHHNLRVPPQNAEAGVGAGSKPARPRLEIT
jgi:hypothetical protein